MPFDLSTAVPVSDKEQGSKTLSNFDIASARPVDISGGDKNPQTDFEKFQQSERDTVMMSQIADHSDLQTKIKSPDNPEFRSDLEKQTKYPSHSFLNHPISALGDIANLTGDVIYSTFGKPLGLAPEASKAVSDEQAQISKDHPIGAIVAGTVPFIMTAPIFPEGLLGLTAQFATISGMSEWGRQRMDESIMKPAVDKSIDILRETGKGALMGPIWHYSGALKFIANPYATAFIRAGIRGVGTAIVDAGDKLIDVAQGKLSLQKFYGDDLASAFKDGGIMSALSLIFESPYLARTALGRGITSDVNRRVYEGLFGGEAAGRIAQTSKPTEINPESSDQDIKEKVLNAANTLSSTLLRQDNKIAAATIILNDGTKVHGSSHEDALGKIGESKDTMKEIFPGISVQRIEEPGVNIDLEKPQGLYTTPADFQSPHEDLGGEKYIIDKNKEAKVLSISGGTDKEIAIRKDANSAGVGIWALREIVGNEKFKNLKSKTKQELIDELKVGYPNVQWSRYYDKQEVLEALGAIKAREKGYDAIDLKDTDMPQFSEYVGLGKKAFSTDPKKFKGTYQAGFTTSEGKFITREESKTYPYNLPNGSSQDVEGLNHQKFMTPPKLPDIVNKDTLKSMVAGEEGKMDIRIIPGVVELTEQMARAAKEYTENIEPTTVSGAAEFTSQDLRERLGKQAQLMDRLEVLLTDARKFFDKATKKSIIETYTKAERGEKQDTPELQKFYDTLQFLLATQRDRVRALGRGKLENFIENYLPHIWEDPKQANLIGRFFSRRPFEGKKSFLKKRTIENFADGIEAGLTPVSWNPVDLTLLKMREMDKYIVAHSAVKANMNQGFAKYVPIGKKAPEEWQKINDNISQILKSPMIQIQEAFDEHVMNKLNEVAKNLGIDAERVVKMRGKQWGSSQRGSGSADQPGDLITGKATSGKVKTKFAGPESVLAHEIGHQIDEKYGLKESFLSNRNNMIIDNVIEKTKKNETLSADEKKEQIKNLRFEKTMNDEFQKLADLRYEGKAVTEGFKKYVRKGSEKMAVMLEAYIHAPDLFKETAPNIFKGFEDFINSRDELKGLSEIKPSLVLGTNKSEVYAGGIVIAGHIYAHPDSARIFNNYLSPGLRGKWLYDVYRTAGNSLVQFRLGISAFHAGFTTLDATISKFAKALNRLSRGDLKGFVIETALTPIAPITNFIEGRKLLQSWYGKDNGALTNQLAELYATGGGRAKMDKFYATQFDNAMSKALKEGKILTATLQVPFWLTQQISRPLMEYLVPRQKMGVFADLMKMELEDNPNMSHEQLRATAQRIVNSVDNRMGQLVYDNLMINRTMKDLGMASVQSLGWNIGSVREIGGGVVDLVGNLNDLRKGKPTRVSYRTAYIMALPMITGLYGAIYQVLHTGLWPAQTDTPAKDYFHPRTGGLDKNGLPARVNLPTYMKDIFSFAKDPVKTAVNKLNPVNSEMVQMFNNEDYYGTEIRNPDDPWVRQAIDELMFIGSGFEPYSFQNLNRDTRRDIPSRIEPFIGITPARFDIDMTKAERAAIDFEKANIPQGARTKAQTAHSQAKAQLRNQFFIDQDKGPLTQAVQDKVITAKEKNDIVKQGKMSRIERLTRHLTADQVMSLVKKAESDQERQQLEDIARKKISNKKRSGTWTQEDQDLFNRFMPENKK